MWKKIFQEWRWEFNENIKKIAWRIKERRSSKWIFKVEVNFAWNFRSQSVSIEISPIQYWRKCCCHNYLIPLFSPERKKSQTTTKTSIIISSYNSKLTCNGNNQYHGSTHEKICSFCIHFFVFFFYLCLTHTVVNFIKINFWTLFCCCV